MREAQVFPTALQDIHAAAIGQARKAVAQWTERAG